MDNSTAPLALLLAAERCEELKAMPEPYSPRFFESIRAISRDAAATVVPLILNWVRPQSVVDLGCGIGSWLAEFTRHRIDDVLGIDGDYVPRELLEIPESRFLARELSGRIDIPRRFDLAMSLEVAEHLPKDSAIHFVQTLVRLAPVVLFSAAIPFQGGTNHLNEQWPDYWARLFDQHGFAPLDCIRPLVWGDPRVNACYAQNMLLFVSEEGLSKFPALQQIPRADPRRLAMVDARIYLNSAEPGFRHALRQVPPAFKRAVRRRLGPAGNTKHEP